MEESIIKKVGVEDYHDDQLLALKPEKSGSSSQKTDTSAVKIKLEDNQVESKIVPTLQNHLINDAEDISSVEEDDLEDISDDEDEKFEEAPISGDNPSSSSLTEKPDDNPDRSSGASTSLPNGYYNPLTKNEEDFQYLITTLKENPKMNACSYCWRIGHNRSKCNDKLWYEEINKKCPIWVEGCWKRKQAYFKVRPELLENIRGRRKRKGKRKSSKLPSKSEDEAKVSMYLPPGDEFEVVEELQSSDEEVDEKLEEPPTQISKIIPPPPARENLILKNEEDLNFLRRCLTEESPLTKIICNYCSRAGHMKRDCEDNKISGIKMCPIWRQGFGQRRKMDLELRKGAVERLQERKRKANMRHKVTRKTKKLQRMEEELQRKEIEEKLKREKLEDEQKRRKIEAAEMLLEIVNELLE